eukprot:363781-Chlamydomonas_euryale.AAC.28
MQYDDVRERLPRAGRSSDTAATVVSPVASASGAAPARAYQLRVLPRASVSRVELATRATVKSAWLAHTSAISAIVDGLLSCHHRVILNARSTGTD